jgi:hypothetical protein
VSGALLRMTRQAVVERIGAEADHAKVVVYVFPTPCRGCARSEVLLQALSTRLLVSLKREAQVPAESDCGGATSELTHTE